MSNNFVVYRIKNMVNGRVYFGSTNNFVRRVAEHQKNMQDVKNKIHNYCRDMDRYGHSVNDFEFRILARFDSQEKMLDREQKLISMYYGTKACYNIAFEVTTDRVNSTIIAWNMRTLEVRLYLSCHALRKDLGVSKIEIQRVMNSESSCWVDVKSKYGTWVFEEWGKNRTIEEVIDLYKKCNVKLPKHALEPLKNGLNSITPIPGFCSIPEMINRRYYVNTPMRKGVIIGPSRVKILSNYFRQFLYRTDSEGTKYDYNEPARKWKKSGETEFTTYIPEGEERRFYVPED